MKLFLTIFGAVLAALLVVVGVLFYRDHQAEARRVNDARVADLTRALIEFESSFTSFDGKSWSAHEEGVRALRDTAARLRPLSADVKAKALEVADEAERTGEIKPHPGTRKE